MTTEAKKVSGSTRTNIVVQVQGQDHMTEPNKIDNTNTNKIHCGVILFLPLVLR